MLWKFNHHRDYRYKYSDNVASRILKYIPVFETIKNDLDRLTFIDFTFEMMRSRSEWDAYIKYVAGKNSSVLFPFMEQRVYGPIMKIPWERKLIEHKKILLDLGRKLGLKDDLLLRPKTGMSVHPFYAKKQFEIFFKLIDEIQKPPLSDHSRGNLKIKLNIYRAWLSHLIINNLIDPEKLKLKICESLIK